MPLTDYTKFFQNRTLVPIRGANLRQFADLNDPSSYVGGRVTPVQESGTPVDLNAQVAYTDKTFQQMRLDTEKTELSRLADFRDLQRQSVVNQGSSMYQQAQIAMEQQRGLSDTRGLTAGAREGATQMLSATQQVALNQIQNATMDQLLQVDAQSLQDPQIAQQFAAKAVELAKMDNPLLVTNEGLLQQATIARDNDDMATYNRLMDEYFDNVNKAYGSTIPTGPGVTPEMIDQGRVAVLARLANERTITEEMLGWVGAVLPPAVTAAMIPKAAAFTAGAIATVKGGGLVATGVAAGLGGGAAAAAAPVVVTVLAAIAAGVVLYWAGTSILKQIDESTKGDRAVRRITEELKKDRENFESRGHSPEQIDAIIKEMKRQAELPPIYDNIDGR